ncbi:MAG: hypothetical protein ABFC28_05490 [Rikenellaceae bacterium]
MKIVDLCSLVNGTVICGEARLGESVEYAFASDLMSDVLTIKIQNFILITGLANIQSIRTADMSGVPYLLLCRNKEVTQDMIDIAEENNMLIIKSHYSLFKCSGILYSEGLKPVY